jgi:signal transduction histidine kinase
MATLEATLAEAVHRQRPLLVDLRPPPLADGLAAAVAASLEAACAEPGIGWHLDDGALAVEPDVDTVHVAVRLVQEAVTNAVRHAGATSVSVALASDGAGLRALVVDDGRGVDLGARPAGDATPPLGTVSMAERAEAAGGWCRIESRRGGGTTVEVWLPASVPFRAPVRPHQAGSGPSALSAGAATGGG